MLQTLRARDYTPLLSGNAQTYKALFKKVCICVFSKLNKKC